MIEILGVKNKNSTSLTKTKDILLSIQFSLDGFSFCTSNFGKILSFKNYPFQDTLKSPKELLENIKRIFKDDIDLQSEFNRLEVLHQNNLFSIVPEDYFDENVLSTYLNYTIKTLKNDFITFDDITALNAKNVYVPYVNINNYLFQNFGEFDYKHHSSVLLQKLLRKNTIDEKVMYVNVSKNDIDIVILENKKLILLNSFSYSSKEDFIYYILFTAEQHQLDTEKFQLFFLGDITKESSEYKISYSYIKNIRFLESKNSIYTSLKLSNHSNYILLG